MTNFFHTNRHYLGDGSYPEVSIVPFDRQDTLEYIARLESQATDRRWREALFTEDGKAWMQQHDAQIAEARAYLESLNG